MSAKHRTLRQMQEPDYEPSDVPQARRDLRGSTISRMRSRQHWLRVLPECLLVCNEAARRFNDTNHVRAPRTGGKPLALDYLADRLDTDGA